MVKSGDEAGVVGILDGVLDEIASSFVSLTPRNDGVSAMTQGFLIRVAVEAEAQLSF